VDLADISHSPPSSFNVDYDGLRPLMTASISSPANVFYNFGDAVREDIECVTISSEDEDVKPIISPLMATNTFPDNQRPGAFVNTDRHAAINSEYIWDDVKAAQKVGNHFKVEKLLRYFKCKQVYICPSCEKAEHSLASFLLHHPRANGFVTLKKDLYRKIMNTASSFRQQQVVKGLTTSSSCQKQVECAVNASTSSSSCPRQVGRDMTANHLDSGISK
jgi:hypothetical protein